MDRETYDLIILGGGIASTFLCLSIFKKDPDFKILILEKRETFPQKIGESLVDLTALYVKSLNIDHILAQHTYKTGVRFLFNESNSPDLSRIAEFASPTFPGLIRGYHLDRSRFDQQLLEEAEKKGATIYRPAEILQASLEEFHNELELQTPDGIRRVYARWVVDATGRSRYVPRQLNWQDKPIKLDTGAIMAHFTHIAPDEQWDTPPNAYWDTKAVGLRTFSTTHLMRKHSWWWVIRLDDTTTSIGVVFDKTRIKIDDCEDYFLTQLKEDVQLSIMTRGAKRGKIRCIETLPYVCDQLYSKGIALIGESGAFLDPFISPGIELIGQQTIWLADLFTEEKRSGTFQPKAWEKYSKTFFDAYDSRLTIYESAYAYMHSYDIFSAWLKQGNFLYFGRIVLPAAIFKQRLKLPLRFNWVDRLALRYFKQRFNRILQKRVQQGRISQTKAHAISYSGVRVPRTPLFFFMPAYLLFKALWAYVQLEFIEWIAPLRGRSTD